MNYKPIQCHSPKFKKKVMHFYKCIIVLNNSKKRSKYFKIINLPSTRIPQKHYLLDNQVGIWRIKNNYI